MKNNPFRDPENGQLMIDELGFTNFVWCIEDCVFSDKERVKEAKKIILSFGDDFYELTGRENEFHTVFQNRWIDIFGINNNPAFVLSSLNWANKLGFYDKEKYNVSNYTNYIGEDFLNHDFVILPLGMLANASEITVAIVSGLFSHSNDYFIKPNSGFKQFTGDCVPFGEIGDFCRDLKQLCVSNETLCIVSSGKKITGEWRFWIIDNEVITYSYYDWADYNEVIEPPKNVKEMAEKLKASFGDLKCFTLDLCEFNGKAKVVEINNVYTSGTYNCDLKKLLTSARAFAIKEYEEIYG